MILKRKWYLVKIDDLNVSEYVEASNNESALLLIMNSLHKVNPDLDYRKYLNSPDEYSKETRRR